MDRGSGFLVGHPQVLIWRLDFHALDAPRATLVTFRGRLCEGLSDYSHQSLRSAHEPQLILPNILPYIPESDIPVSRTASSTHLATSRLAVFSF